MKRIFSLIALSCLLAGLLLGCASPEGAKSANYIGPLDLAEDQQDIFNLVFSGPDSLLLLEYETQDHFRNFDIWIDFYEHGVLVDSEMVSQTYTDEADPRSGLVAMTLSRGETLSWSCKIKSGGALMAVFGEYENDTSSDLGWFSGPIQNHEEIVDGKDIALYSYIASEGGGAFFTNLHSLLEQPELLASYDHAYLVMCRFTA